MTIIIPWTPLIAISLMIIYRLAAGRSSVLPDVPLALFVCYFFLSACGVVLGGFPWSGGLIRYLEIAADVILAWAVARLILWFLIEFLAQFRKSQNELPKITRDFIQFLTFAVLFFIVLRVRSDINLASLLTTSALLTVVIGLAAQATLNNLFSGLIIQAEQPFAIGDWIRFEDYEGTIIGISWKSTQVLTREKDLVYIPNSILASSTFVNYSRPNRKKIARLRIGLDYDASPGRVKQVIGRVLDQNPRVLKQPRYNIRLIAFSDFSIQYEIRFWHNNYAIEPQLKADLNAQLWYALQRAGIQIPFPIRDVRQAHIERERDQAQQQADLTKMRAALCRVPILQPLSETEIDELTGRVHIERFGDGEVIVQEDDPGDSMYLVLSGVCEALRRGHRKKAKMVSQFQTGDFFGEISLLTGENRTATIQSRGETSLIVVNKSAFSAIVQANRQISEKIGAVVQERRKPEDIPPEEPLDTESETQHLIRRIKLFFGV